ncbi:MAG TPA: 50S ribosomal protein L25 [Nitrospirae bacterium]|nr:50S ribosomal protein L25 [Nitrospirota bacterium]
MERFLLNVEIRNKTGKGVARSLRRNGFIPAVVYRAGTSMPIIVNKKEAISFITRSAGEQVVVNLNFGNDIKQAIMKDYQVDPVDSSLLHADFQEILATEEIKVNVHLIIKGEAIGVKRDGGILQQALREIEILCLPDKIIGHIDVDVTNLKINQSIHVRDLKLPDGIKILTDADEVIVTVTTLREETTTTVPEGQETIEPEVIKKGKKQEAGEG